VLFLDVVPSLLSNVMRLKSDLAHIIEPDCGLMDQLFSLEVLTDIQLAEVCSQETVFERNDTMLYLLESEDQCEQFIVALQRTDQQHVINFLSQNGGQEHRYLQSFQYCCLSNNSDE